MFDYVIATLSSPSDPLFPLRQCLVRIYAIILATILVPCMTMVHFVMWLFSDDGCWGQLWAPGVHSRL